MSTNTGSGSWWLLVGIIILGASFVVIVLPAPLAFGLTNGAVGRIITVLAVIASLLVIARYLDGGER